MRTYDFSSLHAPISTAEITTLDPESKSPWVRRVVKGIYVFIFISFVLAMAVAFSVDTDRTGAVLTTLIFFGVLAAVVLIATEANRRRKRYIAIVDRFARANNAKFIFDRFPRQYKGMIFDEGHSRKIIDSLSFDDGVEIGNYEYVTGRGNSQRQHSYGYIRVALNKNLPNMVLDARRNNFIGITNMPDVYQASQRLRLEGNFNDHFDLYAPAKYERDALYVFTPDVMHVLLEKAKTYDMEIVDDELYFYQPNRMNLSSETVLQHALDAVTSIAGELRGQARRYGDERQVAEHVGELIAPDGRRLKKGIKWAYVLIILVVGFSYFLSLGSLPPVADAFLQFGLGIVLIGFGVMQIIIRLRQ